MKNVNISILSLVLMLMWLKRNHFRFIDFVWLPRTFQKVQKIYCHCSHSISYHCEHFKLREKLTHLNWKMFSNSNFPLENIAHIKQMKYFNKRTATLFHVEFWFLISGSELPLWNSVSNVFEMEEHHLPKNPENIEIENQNSFINFVLFQLNDLDVLCLIHLKEFQTLHPRQTTFLFTQQSKFSSSTNVFHLWDWTVNKKHKN